MNPMMTGNAIAHSPEMIRGILSSSGTEIIYSFIIIACSLMIWKGTKELYELSGHKGIKYFRTGFLFFALAYFFGSFLEIVLESSRIGMVFRIPQMTINYVITQTTLMLFVYFSSMAVLYILYSVMWKRWDKGKNKIYIFHAISLILAATCFFVGNNLVYFLINLILLAFIIITFSTSKKELNKKKKKSTKTKGLHTIYCLLFIFWIFNIIDILIPEFFQTFQLLIYLASIGIFLAMLYNVLKKSGSN